jgi:hypothetical protein
MTGGAVEYGSISGGTIEKVRRVWGLWLEDGKGR